MDKLQAAVMWGALIGLAAAPAWGLDPHMPLAQYGYQSWQTDSGLPQNTVHAIVQGQRGYLWIGTEGGLVRFDGVDFAVMTHATAPALPSDLIDDLMKDGAGTVWISTSGGLARMRAGRVEGFGPDRGMPATQVWRTFDEVRPGGERVWVLSAAGLFRIDAGRGSRAERIPLDEDLTENSRMATGRDGVLWLGTAEGLVRLDPKGGAQALGTPGEVLALAIDSNGTAWAGLRSGLEACTAKQCRSIAVPGGDAVEALIADAAGRIWIGTDAGLFAEEDGRMRSLPQAAGAVSFLACDRQGMVWAGTGKGLMRFGSAGAGELLPHGGDVYLTAAEDREGDLWLGTEAGGLTVLRDRKFSSLTAEQGLNEEYVLALAQGPDGAVWAGTKGGGLNVYRGGRFSALTTAQGMASNVVFAVTAAPNGDVWAGTPDGLNLIRDGRVRLLTTADGLADDFVRSLYVGAQGALWIGTRHGLSRYANGAFTTWTAADGLGSDLIGAMTQSRAGDLWIGTLGGLSRMHNGKFTNFTTKDGLSSNIVTALHEDSDGTLWIGTNDGGLNRMRDGKIVPVARGLLPPRVIGILEDRLGYLWISSNSGVYRVSRAGLNAMAGGGPAPEVMRFGVADGMRISECSSGGHPAVVALRDGALWFATLKGIAAVDPEHMPVNRVAPRVALEAVGVDDVAQRSGAALTIAPGHSHYEFDYAGLSFVAPQKVEYRYQLVGFDPNWVEAGTRRTAYYTNLPHGSYTFRVMARNNDGVWSREAATVTMTVEPHMYQTVWFRLLLALALMGLAYAAWRRRLLRVEREFQAVLGERARIAREIHDTLAQGFVAVSVQLELVGQLMRASADAAREQLERTQTLVRSSLEEARSSIWELRSQSAEREDLAARILRMAEDVVSRSGIHGGAGAATPSHGANGLGHANHARVQMQVSGTNHPLGAEVERELMRIAREAVVNAVRHGHPETIALRLEFEAGLFAMEIHDDGRGFSGAPPDGASGHYGMVGMRERAAAIGAELRVQSQSGAGTRVRLLLPLNGTGEA
ncbi:MAG TPA: two-component regulator propeller domain-containing protein [Acidobacteriaceae bacterium]|jgi:ligand-binding sensor domain-containing protein/signal transduction histidine kinase|nr:two-component regulator propeller domain-containing protein [Acidobacteriaceae bacterium]